MKLIRNNKKLLSGVIKIIIVSIFLGSILILNNISTTSIGEETQITTNSRQNVNLKFQISLIKNTYQIGDPIYINATLTNLGTEPINVSEFALGFNSLDFEVWVPEGYEVHYQLPWIETLPDGIKLNPSASTSYETNLRDSFWHFGADNSSLRYDFTTIGNYIIRGIYTSNSDYCWDESVWNGQLVSNNVMFSIIKPPHIVINEIYYESTAKKWWLELYNPTEESINVTGWNLWFYSIDGPISIDEPTIIHSGEYILFGEDDGQYILNEWDVPPGTQVNGLGYVRVYYDAVHISGIDRVYTANESGWLPKIAENHSWARYKYGYDTDNFTNDFYDESTPTPGFENTKSKYDVPDVILEFNSSLDKQKYFVGEPIYVTSTLTNIGTAPVYMYKFSLELNTIDFYISTPEGYDISYKPSVFRESITVFLDPGTSINYTVDITDSTWNFGNNNGIVHYNFTTIGNYTIRSVYTSAFFSSLLNFKVIDKTSNNGGSIGDSPNGNGDSDEWVTITTNYGPGIAVLTICILITISIIAGTEIGKYGFFAAVSPLYTRLDRDDVVQQENRWQIIGFIKGKPGTTYGEIKRKIGIGNGTLAYHLKVLEREELVKSKNHGRYKCFYPIEERIPDEEFRLSNIQKLILDTIRANPGIPQKKIIQATGNTQQAVSYHLNILIRENLIKKKKKGRIMKYYVEEENEFENN